MVRIAVRAVLTCLTKPAMKLRSKPWPGCNKARFRQPSCKPSSNRPKSGPFGVSRTANRTSFGPPNRNHTEKQDGNAVNDLRLAVDYCPHAESGCINRNLTLKAGVLQFNTRGWINQSQLVMVPTLTHSSPNNKNNNAQEPRLEKMLSTFVCIDSLKKALFWMIVLTPESRVMRLSLYPGKMCGLAFTSSIPNWAAGWQACKLG